MQYSFIIACSFLTSFINPLFGYTLHVFSEHVTLGLHQGHFSLQSSDLRVSLKCMTEKERQLGKECSQLHFSPTSSAALLSLRDELGVGIQWNSKQVAYLNRKENDLLLTMTEKGAGISCADKLIDCFKKRNDVIFLSVTYSKDQGLLLLTSAQTKRATRKIRSIELEDDSDVLNSEEFKKMYQSNQLSGSSRLLLIFLFASEEEIRRVRMFPEYCACDTTFGKL